MHDVIASLSLLGVSAEGSEFPIEIRIGKPRADDRCWACTIDVGGLATKPRDIFGADNLQALLLALSMVKFYLSNFVSRGGQLLHAEGREEFLLSSYFADFTGATHQRATTENS